MNPYGGYLTKHNLLQFLEDVQVGVVRKPTAPRNVYNLIRGEDPGNIPLSVLDPLMDRSPQGGKGGGKGDFGKGMKMKGKKGKKGQWGGTEL